MLYVSNTKRFENLALVCCTYYLLLQGANPVSVKVTLRGKKYDVKDATSVEDVQKSVEEQAGLAKEQQVTTCSVSFLVRIGAQNSERNFTSTETQRQCSLHTTKVVEYAGRDHEQPLIHPVDIAF